MNHPARIVALAMLFACAGAPAQPAADDHREADTARIMAASGVDRLILANARAQAMADPKFEQSLDDLLYHVRPPALWNPQHPAWPPARAQLRELVGRDSNAWVQEYWRESALKIHQREFAFGYKRDYVAGVRDFAESAGGRAYFALRLAEARAKAGEAMFSLDPAGPAALEKLAAEARRRFEALPPAEKARVKEFLADDDKWFEPFIDRQAKWIAEVLLSHMGSIPYTSRDAWRAEIDAKLAATLPVDSKKQLLGRLEMRGDGSLVFRFTFNWNNAADGGKLALELPKSHPAYAETLALAPGLAAGQSRVLYRDKDGLIGDKP